MVTIQHPYVISSSSNTRSRVYFLNHSLFILSILILICKIIILAGLMITIFSDHWAKNPIKPDIHTGYKNRCLVHVCTSNGMDSTWLVDLVFSLAIINLFMEFINITITCHFPYKKSQMNIIFKGLMFFLTFIITDCAIVFGIHITSYVYKLPMGYAYTCFMFTIIFSIIEWGLSLKRLTINSPQLIYFSREDELSLHNNPRTFALVINRFAPILEEDIETSLHSAI